MSLSRFKGNSHHKVDAKGRVSVPASFRKVLERGDPDYAEGLRPQFVINYGDMRRKKLDCYTIAAMNEIDEGIDELPHGTTERLLLERIYHGHSHLSEIDKDGRLILPQKLRDLIDLKDEAFFIAAGNRFQIWNPEIYDGQERVRTATLLDGLPDDLEPLAVLQKARG